MNTEVSTRKIVNISPKRQITIPQKFYTHLNFESEAEVFVRNNELVIRPARPALDEDYADMILQDLLKQGYKGEKLKKELEKRKELVKKNIKRLIKEIDESRKKDKLYTYKDVFGEDPK